MRYHSILPTIKNFITLTASNWTIRKCQFFYTKGREPNVHSNGSEQCFHINCIVTEVNKPSILTGTLLFYRIRINNLNSHYSRKPQSKNTKKVMNQHLPAMHQSISKHLFLLNNS